MEDPVEKPQFDVFLSHATPDKPVVEELARILVRRGFQPWLDKWNLIPGKPWQKAIEDALQSCTACAVCLGPSGIGPWQDEEMRAAIVHRVSGKQGFRVIPVLLPRAERSEPARLPAFLSTTSWVEFRGTLDDEEALRRLICGIRGIEPGPGLGEAVAEGACPYQGLEAFDVGNALFFFGREALTERLLDKLRPDRSGTRLLLIVGPSGSGKSSLARAGLLASLKRGEIPGSDLWPDAICKPGAQPLESLALALTGAARLGDSPSALRELIRDLGTEPRMLHLTTRLALRDAPPDQRLVVLVDQLEEVFTLCSDEAQRQAFIANLLHAATAIDGRTVVVLTLRADFYGRCAAYPELAAAVSEGHALVGPMTREELRSAIQRPAYLVGHELEGGLADLLLNEVQGQPGSLPLLEYALLEIWRRREGGRRLTIAAYHEVGGVAGALERRAEEVFSGFTEDEREICRRIFLKLVQVDEQGRATRRRRDLSELTPASGADAQAMETVVARLIQSRLLTASEEKRPTVELAHEALLTGWDRLRTWVEQAREALRTRRRLDEAVAEWLGSGRDPSCLYRGARLAQAEEWAGRHPGELGPTGQEFLAASIAHRDEEHQRELAQVRALEEEQRRRADAEHQRAEEKERANRKLKRRAVAFAMAAVVALTAALAVWYLLGESEKKRRINLASHLANHPAIATNTDPSLGLLLSIEAMRLADKGGQPDLPPAEESLRRALSLFRGRPLSTGRVRATSVSADGIWLAVAGSDGALSTWKLTDGGPVKSQSLPAASGSSFAQRIAMGPNGRWLLAGYESLSNLFNLNTKGPSVTVDLGDEDWLENSDPFSPDGRWLLTRQGLDSWVLRDLSDPARPTIATLRIRPEAATFSPDGRWLAVAEPRALRVWDLTAPSGRPKLQTPGAANPEALAFSSDSQWLVAAGGAPASRTVQAWRIDPAQGLGPPLRLDGCAWSAPLAPDFRDPILLSRIPSLSGCLDKRPASVTAAALDPEEKRYALGYEDGSVRLSDLEPGSIGPLSFRSQAGPIQRLAFHGRWLVTQGGKDAPRVLEVPSGPNVAAAAVVEPVLTAAVPGVVAAVSSSGWRLIIDPASRQARLWGPRGPRPVNGAASASPPWVFSPDGRWLAAIGDGRPLVWRVQEDGTASAPVSFPVQFRHASPVSVLVFSPDGRWLATGDAGAKGYARLWAPQAPNAEPHALTNSHGGVKALAFSLDGRLIATAAGNGNVRLRELKDDGPALTDGPESRQASGTTALSFLPDGRLALGGLGGRVLLWKPGQPDVFLDNNSGAIVRLSASPRGGRLASSSANGTVQIWSLNGENLQALPVKLPVPGPQLASTLDGNGLWTVDRGGRLRRWELRIDKLLETACRTVGRNLTPREWKAYIPSEPYHRIEPCPEFPRAFD